MSHPSPSHPAASGNPEGFIKQFRDVFRYSPKALALVWDTSRGLMITVAVLTLLGGLLPGALAYVSKLIVDAIVLASETGQDADKTRVYQFITFGGGYICCPGCSSAGTCGLPIASKGHAWPPGQCHHFGKSD